MLGSIDAMISTVIHAALSVVGYRRGTAEPDCSAEKLTAALEIRRYGCRIAAETVVTSDEEGARNTGFRRLARYIFGANRVGEKIAMTAPVSQKAAGEGNWVIRFFMPADKTLDSCPVPDDPEVKLVALPPETIAVHRFAGTGSSRAVAVKTAELMNTLRANGLKAVDTPTAWFYDPPWTIPALRRNEIAVPVEPAS